MSRGRVREGNRLRHAKYAENATLLRLNRYGPRSAAFAVRIQVYVPMVEKIEVSIGALIVYGVEHVTRLSLQTVR